MASYYYLISSLPMLKADGELPFSYNEFLKMCRSALSPAKYKLLEELTVDSSNGPLIEEWAKFYGVLAREMTYQRNLRLGKPCSVPYDRDESAVKTVSAAISARNPLDAESMLLSLEFERLDQLIGTHYFDDYALNGYALKLKLLERQSSFEKEKGQAEFAKLLGGIKQQIFST